jgi:hypothetical protein
VRGGRELEWLVFGSAVLAPAGTAAALIPARSHTENTNIALVLVVVVVAISVLGRRWAAALSAMSAALWFEFFHTRPYYRFTINAHDDLVSAILLLGVGLAVGELAVRGRRHRAAAKEGSNEIARIHAVAERVAGGEPAEFGVVVVANELRDLLSLRDCRFDRYTRGPDDKPIARIERSGDVVLGELRWGVHSMGLPGKEVELLVQGQGRTLGRFLLEPTPGMPVSFDRRVVAVALADQVGAALASASPVSGA